MTYSVKEIFLTLQGEGAHSGRVAVFCRFAGCNLWSGLERDRLKAVCRFCDTDFVGTDGSLGGKYASAESLADAVERAWGQARHERRFVVITGGEPLLQLDEALIQQLHDRSFEIAVETNGTIVPPAGIDWLCVSPKAGANLKISEGDELKLVFPQEGAAPEQFAGLDFKRFSLQAMDGEALPSNLDRTIAYCLTHPQWQLSVQTHKTLGIR
jgi:7-carboxy-7-deazaguanine synthase